ncbi:MAG: hypothetical protein FRX49_11856 [Trebouxia sp. A1-2]|nr:MAG: hypothetical protein FRX49_11856 [Trebouxia sp. A1-2]
MDSKECLFNVKYTDTARRLVYTLPAETGGEAHATISPGLGHFGGAPRTAHPQLKRSLQMQAAKQAAEVGLDLHKGMLGQLEPCWRGFPAFFLPVVLQGGHEVGAMLDRKASFQHT